MSTNTKPLRDAGVYRHHGVIGILNYDVTLFSVYRLFCPIGQDWADKPSAGLPGCTLRLTEAEVDALEPVNLTPEARLFLAAHHLRGIHGVAEVCDNDRDERGPRVYLWASNIANDRVDACAAFFGLTAPEVEDGGEYGTWRTYRLPHHMLTWRL